MKSRSSRHSGMTEAQRLCLDYPVYVFVHASVQVCVRMNKCVAMSLHHACMPAYSGGVCPSLPSAAAAACSCGEEVLVLGHGLFGPVTGLAAAATLGNIAKVSAPQGGRCLCSAPQMLRCVRMHVCVCMCTSVCLRVCTYEVLLSSCHWFHSIVCLCVKANVCVHVVFWHTWHSYPAKP